MSDPEIPVNPPAAPAASVVDAVVSAPAAGPSVETTPVVTTPAAFSEAAASSAPPIVAEPAKAEAPAAEPSLLGAEPKEPAKVEDKKLDAPKPEAKADAKPEGDKPAEVKIEDAPLPTYEAFKLPETFKVDDKAMGDFTGLLGKLELAKGDHKATQEIGQQMADLYAANMASALEKQQEYFVTLNNQNKQAMLDELKKDPYFGAGGDQDGQLKVQMELAIFLQKNIPKEDLTAFRKFVDEKGVGDALPLARLINTLKQKIDKYEKEPDSSKTMLPGTKPAPTKSAPGKGILQTLYGKAS
jgi:hypothetical protein